MLVPAIVLDRIAVTVVLRKLRFTQKTARQIAGKARLVTYRATLSHDSAREIGKMLGTALIDWLSLIVIGKLTVMSFRS